MQQEMKIFQPSAGLWVAAASASQSAESGATEVAQALAANLRYLRRRPAEARTPDRPPPDRSIFDIVDGGAASPSESGLPVVLVAAEGATEITLPAGCEIIGVIARSRPVPASEVPVMGVFPPIGGDGPSDPMWLGKAADHLESRVDLWPILQLAAPRPAGPQSS
jgi:hypothetical protein